MPACATHEEQLFAFPPARLQTLECDIDIQMSPDAYRTIDYGRNIGMEGDILIVGLKGDDERVSRLFVADVRVGTATPPPTDRFDAQKVARAQTCGRPRPFIAVQGSARHRIRTKPPLAVITARGWFIELVAALGHVDAFFEVLGGLVAPSEVKAQTKGLVSVRIQGGEGAGVRFNKVGQRDLELYLLVPKLFQRGCRPWQIIIMAIKKATTTL